MSWSKVRLADVCTVGRGSSPRPIKDERFFTDGQIPWVKIADATASGKYVYHTNQYVNEYGASFSRLLPPGSLIFPASGTLGIPRFLGVHACIHDGWLYFTDFEGIEPEYLYYKLVTLKSFYESIAYGAAIQNINTELVRNTEIELPDREARLKIVAILSSYDELIEANQRRIQLLEESARLLYREWFVKLKFPGHETVSVTDGVPEGWELKPVSEMIDANPWTPFPKDVTRPFVGMEALSEDSMVIDASDARPITGGAKFRNSDTLLARITPCLENGKTGFVQFLEDDEAVASGSTEFIVLRSRTVNPHWIYCLARSDSFREHAINSMAGSDGRQRVNTKCFDQYITMQPPSDVLQGFDDNVRDIFGQVQSLSLYTRTLKQARDLLLPKLMSGAMDVSRIAVPKEVEV